MCRNQGWFKDLLSSVQKYIFCQINVIVFSGNNRSSMSVILSLVLYGAYWPKHVVLKWLVWMQMKMGVGVAGLLGCIWVFV